MTIEAGVLALRITEQGADQVLAKLNQIDQKAQQMGQSAGKATQAISFNTPSVTAASGQVQALTMNLTKLSQVQQQLIQQGPQMAGPIRLLQQPLPNPVQPATVPAVQNLGSMLQNLALRYATVQFAAQEAMRAASAVVGFLGDQIEAGDAMHDFAIRTGVSVETLFTLSRVANNANANIEQLVTGFRALNIKTSEALAGNKEAAEAFQRIGISVADLRDKNPEQVFLMVANGLAKYGDSAFAAEEAQKLLGRGGNVLLTMMQELAGDGFDKAKQHLQELGGAMSTDFANKSDAFKDKVGDMHTALSALGRAIDITLLPSLSRLVDMLTTLIIRYQKFTESPTRTSGLAGFLSVLPGGAALAALLPGREAMFAGVQSGSSTTSPVIKSAPPIAIVAKKQSVADAREAAEIAAAIQREERLGRVRDIVGENLDPGQAARMEGLKPADKLKGDTAAAKLVDKTLGRDKEIAEEFAKKQQFIGGLAQSVAGSIGSAFGDAFSAAFKNGDNFFAALGKSLLAGFGNIIMQLGEQMIEYAALTAILGAVPGPWQALGWGAVATGAVGVGLVALGAAMGAAGGKGGKGGGAGGGRGGSQGNQQDDSFALAFDPDRKLRHKGGSAVVPPTRALSNAAMPEGRAPIVFAPTIIGVDDKRAQKQIAYMVERVVMDGGARGIKKAG